VQVTELVEYSSSQASESRDALTGLLTVSGWLGTLENHAVPEAGGLIAFDVMGIGGVNQTYGREAGDTLLRVLIERTLKALPGNAVLFRGTRNTFFAWLPGVTGMVAQAFTSHLRQAMCAEPIRLSTGEQLMPRLIMTAVTAEAGRSSLNYIQTLERELVQAPGFNDVPPARMARAVSARAALDHKLEAMRLFGRDGWVEQILSKLNLPGLLPVTVLLLGAPQAGKTRLLNSVGQLLGGQHLPLAQVTCEPSDQNVPFTLMVALIFQFFTAYPAQILQQRFAGICRANPWLPGLFPALPAPPFVPKPPEDTQQVRHGLELVMMELIRAIPHVAIVHDLHRADSESIVSLATLQGTSGHGLRIIGGAEPEEGDTPATLHRLARITGTAVLNLPPLTQDQVLNILREVAPDIAQPAVASALFKISGGLPLAVEATLRSWVEDGQLTLNAQGVWEFYPEKVGDAPEAGLNTDDAFRLGVAALAGPSNIDFLAALWRTNGESARGTVDRGRALGYLRPVDVSDPDFVRFTDSDQAAAVSMRLNTQQRTDAHALIAELLERSNKSADSGERFSRDLAYHYSAAGELERAQQLAASLQLITPALIPPQAASLGPSGGEAWDMPAMTELAPEDVPLVIDAAMTVRLAGVQLRLYPPNAEIVRRTITDAVSALNKLFVNRSGLTISYDNHTIAFDGQIFQRRDLQLVLKDYQTWMAEAHLRAIGIVPGVTEDELTRFLQTLAIAEVLEGDNALHDRLMALELENIKLLGLTFQHNLNSMGGGGAQPQWNPVAMPTGTVTVPMGMPRMLPPDGMPAPLRAAPGNGDGGPSLPAPLMNLLTESGATTAATEMRGTPPPLKLDTMSPEEWRELSGMLTEANARARRMVMNGVVRMLRDTSADAAPLPSAVDGMLTQRVAQEADLQVLRETLQAAERRIEGMTVQHNWDGIFTMLESIRRRLDNEKSPEVVTQLNEALDHIGTDTALRGLIDETIVKEPDNLERVRRVMSQLGSRALRPLITALKNASSIQERAKLMQLLREFGNIELSLLLQELRENNPWYVYRNLLQVLAEVGNEEALSAVSKMIHHADPRVRSEAVVAAVRIAREKSAPYLLEGMNDEVPEVRARAVSLVGICPQPNIEEQVLRLLQPRMGREEPPGVQLAACLALGHFDTDSARDVLLQILYPRLFSPYRKKSDDVRSAAVAALAEHLDHPAVQHGIQQATRDRAAIVRQTAQRIWQQHLIQISIQPTE
jgi:HEAT repeat protein/GGDEF domain-containing protein